MDNTHILFIISKSCVLYTLSPIDKHGVIGQKVCVTNPNKLENL